MTGKIESNPLNPIRHPRENGDPQEGKKQE
jgi:hypothetical protein